MIFIKLVESNKMKLEEFEIGLSFHQSLVRRKISDKSINEVRDYIKNGGKKTKLHKAVLDRIATLKGWVDACYEFKFSMYSSGKKSPPSIAVFMATMEVMDGEKVFVAAKSHSVNTQCIHSLRRRLKNYDHHAELLANASKKVG